MAGTVADAENYGRTHPTRDGGSWNGWCASLCWRSLLDSSAPSDGSAEGAGDRSNIQSNVGSAAPRGAFHFWHLGTDGHVATDLDGGGTRLMMASGHCTDVWGQAIGTVSLDTYNARVPDAEYRGWATNYIGTQYADFGSSSPAGGGGSALTPGQELVIIDSEEDPEMSEPIYAKGSTSGAVYALYLNAGANNKSAALQGAVYAARRYVEKGEYSIVESIGFPHPQQVKGLITIPQADFDKIPKVFGSK